MLTKENRFTAKTLDFSTLAIAEDDITIEFKPQDIEDEKYMLCVNGFADKFSPEIWVIGEKQMDYDEETEEFNISNRENDPYIINYKLTDGEANSIKWALLKYFFCFFYGGAENALAEML